MLVPPTAHINRTTRTLESWRMSVRANGSPGPAPEPSRDGSPRSPSTGPAGASVFASVTRSMRGLTAAKGTGKPWPTMFDCPASTNNRGRALEAWAVPAKTRTANAQKATTRRRRTVDPRRLTRESPIAGHRPRAIVGRPGSVSRRAGLLCRRSSSPAARRMRSRARATSPRIRPGRPTGPRPSAHRGARGPATRLRALRARPADSACRSSRRVRRSKLAARNVTVSSSSRVAMLMTTPRGFKCSIARPNVSPPTASRMTSKSPVNRSTTSSAPRR